MFIGGHDKLLVSRIAVAEYGSAANFALTHSAGRTVSDHWRLTVWRPETPIGQQARGRVFDPIPLHARGFESYARSDETDVETASLYSKIIGAGDRLDTTFGDPFARQRHEFRLQNAGPIWLAARELLIEFDKTPTPARTAKDAWAAYNAARYEIVKALMLAPDRSSEFIVPVSAALEMRESGRYDQAEQMLRDAAEDFALDVDAWAQLASGALRASQLDQALEFAEAAVSIAERSIPDRFSGTLQWGSLDNRPYLRGRHALTFALWRLGRFEDAYKVAVDSIWLNPEDNHGFRFVLSDLKQEALWRGPWLGV